MAEDVVPDDLRGFILDCIDSVAQLEALLLLRANPHEDWSVQRTAGRLYVGEQEAADALSRLCAQGLLDRAEDSYRYSSIAPERKDMVDRLASAYTRHLIPVTNLIHRKPGRIREFADAFKFKRER